ncbi:MAG: hemolysin family protein [Candidatus Zixiibacteriota bacterium]
MDRELLLELAAIVVLVLANGLFALAEFSIISSRLSRLAQKSAEKKWGATRARKLRSDPERFLASIQVGITLVTALMGVFSGATIVAKIEAALMHSPWQWVVESATTLAMGLVVVGITILSVVIGELVPKYIALSYPERFARYVAAPAGVFIKLTAPFSRMLSWQANAIVRMLGFKRSDSHHHVTEEEINVMVLEGKRRGVFDETEHEFIRSVFDFADSTARRAMTPRPDVIALDRTADPEAILRTITEQGYSRYPVYEETIDKVIGVIHTKDLIERRVDLGRIDLGALIRPALFVPDSMPLPRLLKEFQRGRNHMAIVLDEFGGTAGIITIEDILEELVGEIQDEYDAEPAPIARLSESSLFADGDVWPGDANELIDSHLPEDEHDTLAGLLLEALGRLPDKYEAVNIADARLTVLAKSENRILRLKVEKISSEATPRA